MEYCFFLEFRRSFVNRDCQLLYGFWKIRVGAKCNKTCIFYGINRNYAKISFATKALVVKGHKGTPQNVVITAILKKTVIINHKLIKRW